MDTTKTTTMPSGAVTVTTVKSGWKTSEFWLSLIAQGLGSLVGIGLIPTDSIWSKVAGFVLAGLATMGYSKSRGAAKQ